MILPPIVAKWRDRNRAQLDFEAAFGALYPVRSTVPYLYAGRIRQGVILQHGFGERVKVENKETGGQCWVTMSNIAGAALDSAS